MHRIDTPGSSGGDFVDRDPVGGIPGTVIDAAHKRAVQEELVFVIEQAGIVLAKGTNTQLRAAIQKMITDAQKRIQIDGATFEGAVADGDIVYWDDGNSRFDKAIADSTNKNQAIGVADVTNAKVQAFGETSALFAGLTPGARYFLSESTPGGIVTAAPPELIPVGIAKAPDVLFVDIEALGAVADTLPMGQAVLSGAVDANGYADFLSAGAGLSVDLEADPVPLLLALSTGWDANGAKGFLVEISADLAAAWSALTVSSTLYLYIDRNSATGAITYGFSSTVPSYGYAHPAAPAIGDHSFLIPEMKMYERVAGPAWAEKHRVFVGEVDTDGAGVTAVRTYALRGEYDSGYTATVPGAATLTTKNSNLGVVAWRVQILIECTTADAGYSVGDVVVPYAIKTNVHQLFNYFRTRNVVGFTTGPDLAGVGVLHKTTGQPTTIIRASWKYKLISERGW